MAAVTIFSDFGAQEKKYVTISIVSPSIRHKVMGPDAMIFVLWMLSFKCWEDQLIQLFIKPFFIVFLGAWTVLGAGDTKKNSIQFLS